MVRDRCGNVSYFEGSVAEILVIVRNFVYEGYEMINHPLAASMRLLFSPYKSVILAPKTEQVNFCQAQIIETSIEKYLLLTAARDGGTKNEAEYQYMDYMLLQSALKEMAHQF